MGFSTVLAVLLASILANAICFHLFDRNYHDNLTFGDSLWYSVISITTIGYGDFSAQSTGARVSTVLFIVIVGLAAFSILFGMLIDAMAAYLIRGQKGLGRIMANEQVLIVNFPSETRVRQIIDEIQAESRQKTEIVVVADDVEELPFSRTDVLFVRGSTHDTHTYQRARVERARMAIVLSRDYADANSDALVAAAVSVIDKLNDKIHIVAECVDQRHRPLFDAVRCNAIVPGLHIAANLLVQEIQDPGISQMIEVITSNRIGATLYTTAVDSDLDLDYISMAKALLDHGVNFLAFNRNADSITEFTGHRPQREDRMIYIADRRLGWGEIAGLAGVAVENRP